MIQDLTVKRTRIEDNSVVIRKFIKGIDGGRTLDLTGYTGGDTVPCGTVIISAGDSTGKTYKPLAITPAVPEKTNSAWTEWNALTDAEKAAKESDGTTLSHPEPPKTTPGTPAAYAALGTREQYVGLLVSTITKDKPAAAIMTWGVVNEGALPCPLPADFKTACKFIDYQTDEEA